MQATEPLDILHVVFAIQHERWYFLATKCPGHLLGHTPESCIIRIEMGIIKCLISLMPLRPDQSEREMSHHKLLFRLRVKL